MERHHVVFNARYGWSTPQDYRIKSTPDVHPAGYLSGREWAKDFTTSIGQERGWRIYATTTTRGMDEDQSTPPTNHHAAVAYPAHPSVPHL